MCSVKIEVHVISKLIIKISTNGIRYTVTTSFDAMKPTQISYKSRSHHDKLDAGLEHSISQVISLVIHN
jgi:hypothetical protein